jgi:hypothetical protein
MIGNINIWIEEDVWRAMATIADRMSKNPTVKVGPELAQTRAQIQALKNERQHQIDSLVRQLSGCPNDEDARQQLVQGNERLADLQIAEAILTALAD